MRRLLPVLALFVLSPLIAELVFGATTISNIAGLLPTSLLYGGGAILIRELARRRGPGWARIVLLGAAYAVVEEGLAIQSIFNPNLFNAGLVGGQALGVNWVWTEWALGYHIFWSIALPILIAEIMFPARRSEPWLGTVGTVIAGVVFALGALAVGAIFRSFVAPDFRAGPVLLVSAALIVVILAALALGMPGPIGEKAPPTTAGAPSPWLVGLATMIVAAAWFVLLGLPESIRHTAVVIAPMLIDLGLAAGLVVLLRRWSASEGWNESHRMAVATGAVLMNWLFGFFFVTAGNPVDQIGVAVFGLLTLALLVTLAWRRRPAAVLA